jgi:hypothetical protein
LNSVGSKGTGSALSPGPTRRQFLDVRVGFGLLSVLETKDSIRTGSDIAVTEIEPIIT